jgi:hypothetical protein
MKACAQVKLRVACRGQAGLAAVALASKPCRRSIPFLVSDHKQIDLINPGRRVKSLL